MTQRCKRCRRNFERPKGRIVEYCPTCRRKRFVESADQSHAKQGPFYERSVLGALKYWHAEADRLGLVCDHLT